jgi:hypothetical protein
LRAGLRRERLLPDVRRRELEPPLPDVLLLRDTGGEDVRVAMLRNLRDSPTCHMCHTPRGMRVVTTSQGAQRSPDRLSGTDRGSFSNGSPDERAFVRIPSDELDDLSMRCF